MDHLYIAILILYYFYMDLNSKEDIACINGRRKRIKSFVPYAQDIVSSCVSSIQAIEVNTNPQIQREIRITFIQSFIQLQAFVELI